MSAVEGDLDAVEAAEERGLHIMEPPTAGAGQQIVPTSLARRRAPLSVRMDDGLAADLAVMARAGLSASDAVRIALSVVAGAYEAAWATGAVPEGVQPEITGCTGVRMTGRAGRSIGV
jgi:hypothetical protein